MAKGLVKYDINMRLKLIELSSEGASMSEMARLLGINRNTIRRWRESDKSLDEAMNRAYDEGLRHIAVRGLKQLAEGVTTVETTKETVETDNNGMPIKTRVRTTKHAPNFNAVKTLAKRYAPELEIHDAKHETHIVNIDSMSYKELLEYRSKHNVLDAEYHTIDDASEATDILSDSEQHRDLKTPLEED